MGAKLYRNWRYDTINVVEPYYEIISEGGKLLIVVDMPGAYKDKISVEVGRREVVISAIGYDIKYYAIIRLKQEVIPETAKAKYKNGVLTIEIKRKKLLGVI